MEIIIARRNENDINSTHVRCLRRETFETNVIGEFRRLQ